MRSRARERTVDRQLRRAAADCPVVLPANPADTAGETARLAQGRRKPRRQPLAQRARAEVPPARIVDLATGVNEVLGGLTLGGMLPFDKESFAAGVAALLKITEGVGARDPLERMLIEQLAWCHQRVRVLSAAAVHLGAGLGSPAHDHCDKAMNSYRRGMLALKRYREASPSAPRMAVAQLNQAGQQNIILAAAAAQKTMTNELGANHGNDAADRRQPQEPAAMDRSHAGWPAAAS